MTEIKQEVSTLVKEFFADECEVDVNDITDNTRIIEDLDDAPDVPVAWRSSAKSTMWQSKSKPSANA
ncbi:hypothetical protein [Methylobacter sp.]|uniref:hypothetical protein n=1 Tax=Methylobacter sp. TaxID=2051955 RepID=UPI003DA31F2B